MSSDSNVPPSVSSFLSGIYRTKLEYHDLSDQRIAEDMVREETPDEVARFLIDAREFMATHPDEFCRYIRLNVMASFDDHEKIREWLGSFLDLVSEQRKTQNLD